MQLSGAEMLDISIKVKYRNGREHVHGAHHLYVGIHVIQYDGSVVPIILLFSVKGDVMIGITAVHQRVDNTLDKHFRMSFTWVRTIQIDTE